MGSRCSSAGTGPRLAAVMRIKNVLRAALGILYEDIEVPVVLEYTRVNEFQFRRLPVSRAVAMHEFCIRERSLWVLVQVLHVGMCRSAVEVVVIFFDIFAVVAFVAC